MPETNLREKFEDKVREKLEQKTPAILKGIRLEILIKTINTHSPFLVSYILQLRHGIILAKLIGEIQSSKLFYSCDNDRFYIETSKNASPPAVDLMGSVEETHINEILIYLNNTLSMTDKAETRIPTGYFLFEFKAQWAVGGEEMPKYKDHAIIEAENFEKACEEFKNSLYSRTENCFNDFFVRDKNGSYQLLVDGTAYKTVFDFEISSVVFTKAPRE